MYAGIPPGYQNRNGAASTASTRHGEQKQARNMRGASRWRPVLPLEHPPEQVAQRPPLRARQRRQDFLHGGVHEGTPLLEEVAPPRRRDHQDLAPVGAIARAP